MVLLLGLCVLLQFGRCHTVRCKTLLFALRSYPGLGFLCPDCLGVLSVYFGLGCVFFLIKLFDVSIVFRMVSSLYFMMSSFAFFLRVLHISAYSMQSLAVFFTISLRFFISAPGGVDNLDVSFWCFVWLCLSQSVGSFLSCFHLECRYHPVIVEQ